MMTKPRKVPLRKCIATGEMKPKKELIRIVRSKEGVVSIDPTGKKSGRGAYLTINEDVILKARKKDLISTIFKVKVDEAIYDELLILTNKEVGNL